MYQLHLPQYVIYSASLVAQAVKRLSTMQETWVQSLGREDPLEKEMAIQSSTIAWKIHGRRSLVGYSPWGRKESDMTEHTFTQYVIQVFSTFFNVLLFMVVVVYKVTTNTE